MDNSSSSNSSKSGRYQNDRKTVFGELQRKFVGALQEVEDQVVIKGSYNRRIFTFLDDILGLERINPNINRKEKGHKILPQAMIMKAFLDLDVLRALCLMPPEGCSLERWQCLAGPCRSNIHIKCHDVRSVKALRFLAGHNDDLPRDYFQKYIETWSNFETCGIKKGEIIKIGAFSPLMLFPVKALNSKIRESILEILPILEDVVDEMFICCEHLKPPRPKQTSPETSKGSSKAKTPRLSPSEADIPQLPLPLTSASFFNYSLEYLNEQVCAGALVFSEGRRKLTDGPFLSILAEKIRNEPEISLPNPGLINSPSVTSTLLNLSHRMATIQNGTSMINQYLSDFSGGVKDFHIVDQ